MAMTKQSKHNIMNADKIFVEQSDYDISIWLVKVVKDDKFSYVPCNYTSHHGAINAVKRIKPTAPIHLVKFTKKKVV